jgi:hypothetical protein
MNVHDEYIVPANAPIAPVHRASSNTVTIEEKRKVFQRTNSV